MELRHCFMKFVFPVVLATGSITGRVVAQTQSAALPDSQVEANVLRSLAGASELSTQPINTTTVGGTVTLSGSVQTETQRRRAEQLASTTPGVQRVVDELTITSNGFAAAQTGTSGIADDSAGRVLQSDGTYAVAGNGGDNAINPYPQNNQATQIPQSGNPAPQGEVPPPNGPDTDPYGRPLNGQQAGAQQPGTPPASQNSPYPQQNNPYSNPQQGTNQPYYGQPPMPPQRPGYYGAYGPPAQQYGPGYGQTGGQTVTVPSGTLLRVRVNQHLSSRDINVGTPFDAMVESDIVADGQVAIPRGAFVQGTVVEAESSGHLKGRGELGLHLTQITLGGKVYPITSDTFSAHGGDKTIQTVNSAVGLGALGAIFGAIAGGGAGAAIGAGVGGAAGIGSSAASGRGDVFIPSEAVLSFRLTQPASLTTVSQAEMQRLASNAPQGRPVGAPIYVRRRYPYPYGPAYYGPAYYRPYGYYPY